MAEEEEAAVARLLRQVNMKVRVLDDWNINKQTKNKPKTPRTPKKEGRRFF